MGTVYRAHRDDGQFRHQVAIKVLRGSLRSEWYRQRFLSEREILARLNHPNIARLLDGGMTAEGEPYLVMELIEGQPLDAYCDTRRLPLDKRLALFGQVLDAVDYAHRSLVVHRDLKPSNILVTPEGQAKLVRFRYLQAGGSGCDDDLGSRLTPASQPRIAARRARRHRQ